MEINENRDILSLSGCYSFFFQITIGWSAHPVVSFFFKW